MLFRWIEKQEEHHANRHRRVGDIENIEPVKLVAEEFYIGNIDVDEIDDLSVEERRVIVEQTVEHTVDEIADRAAQNHCECYSQPDVIAFAAATDEIYQEDACRDRKCAQDN